MAVDLAPELLEILACPNCHGALAVDHDRDELVCVQTDCGLAYPVRDGIPVLLIDEARRPGVAGSDAASAPVTSPPSAPTSAHTSAPTSASAGASAGAAEPADRAGGSEPTA